MLSAAFVNAIFFSAFQVLGPAVAKAELGGSGAWAAIAAASGLGAIGGSVLGFVLRPRRPLLVSEALALGFGLPVALLALPATTALIAAAALLSGAIGSLSQVLWESTWVQHVPEAARSRVSAYDWFGSLALEPLGLALVGPLAAGIGTSTTLWLGAATIFACQALVLVAVPSVRRLQALPDAPVAVTMPPIGAGD